MIDLRQMPASASATGIHWQVSQATSLANIVFQMSTAAGNAHQGTFRETRLCTSSRQPFLTAVADLWASGIWMENGSGGYMGGMCSALCHMTFR